MLMTKKFEIQKDGDPMNIKSSIWTVSMILALTACSSTRMTEEPTRLPSATGTPTLPAVPTRINTPTATATETTPEFQILDGPTIKVVPLSQLQFGHPIVIYAAKPVDGNIYQFSSPKFTPSPAVFLAKARTDSLKFSPDNQWFVYPVFTFKDQDRLAHYDIWLGSTIRQVTPSLIIKDLGGDINFWWLNNSQVIIATPYGRNFDCPGNIIIVDPFLKTKKRLPDWPKIDYSSCFPVPLLNPDLSKAIYLESDQGWKQVDFASMTTTGVFSTLKDAEISSFRPKYLFWDSDGISFAFLTSNQIRYARNLAGSEITTANQSKLIQLPPHMTSLYDGFEWWDLKKGLVAFDLQQKEKKELTFAIANLDDLTLKNYKIDRNSFAGNKGTAFNIVSSSDGRFLGWTLLKDGANNPWGSLILDTQTGEVSFLKDYQILGLGEAQP
jgi:hypothetical protein